MSCFKNLCIYSTTSILTHLDIYIYIYIYIYCPVYLFRSHINLFHRHTYVCIYYVFNLILLILPTQHVSYVAGLVIISIIFSFQTQPTWWGRGIQYMTICIGTGTGTVRSCLFMAQSRHLSPESIHFFFKDTQSHVLWYCTSIHGVINFTTQHRYRYVYTMIQSEFSFQLIIKTSHSKVQ